MKVTNKIFILAITMVAAMACEEDHPVTRSSNLSIFGATETYVGDVATYEAPLYVLNDTRTWSWGVEGDGADPASTDGEFFDVLFSKPGTFTVSLSEGGRYGEMEVEVFSKVLALDGDEVTVTETFEEEDIAIPLGFSNYFANEVVIDFSISGTAVEGVDYEVITPSPLILDESSAEEDYAIYVRLLPDAEIEEDGKTIVVTLNSVTPELADEVIFDEDVNLLSSTVIIEDDLKDIYFSVLLPENVNEAGIRTIEVKQSSGSSVPVKVNYSISGIGIGDVTPDGPGEITFEPGETSKLIYLQFNSEAFDQDQEVIVELTSLAPLDSEVTINEMKNQKKFVVTAP